MKKMLNARTTTLVALAIVAVILGLWSIAYDFKLTSFVPELGIVISILFSVVIISEIGMKSVIKRNLGVLEIIGLSAVGITLITTTLSLFGVEATILGGIAGTVKAFLIIIAIAMLFSKQRGE